MADRRAGPVPRRSWPPRSTAPDSPLHVVATLRADHYDVPLQHPSFAELVTDGHRHGTPDDARRARAGRGSPAADVGVEVEPAWSPSWSPGSSNGPLRCPLLQFALTEVFERRVSGVMLASTHQELGGLTGAIAARADRIVDAGGEPTRPRSRRIFGRLVTLGEGSDDTRRRALRAASSAVRADGVAPRRIRVGSPAHPRSRRRHR